jgi:hypothetical protein
MLKVKNTMRTTPDRTPFAAKIYGDKITELLNKPTTHLG